VKFNPITKRLYTDEGVLIKQLHCPYRMTWGALAPTNVAFVRRCGKCERTIVDTAGMADETVLSILRRDPSACLKVSFDQDNLRVVYQDVR
jgi:hypothetical protein